MKKLIVNIISLTLLTAGCYCQVRNPYNIEIVPDTPDGTAHAHRTKKVVHDTAHVVHRPDRGFIDISTGGILLPSGSNSYYTFTQNFQTCNGYRFNNYFAILGGVGADIYGDNIMIPIFINPSITFMKGSVSPILEPEFGYSLASAPRFWGLYGMFINICPGLKVNVAPKCDFVVCIGYERQYFSSPYITQVLDDINQTYPTEIYNVLSFVNVRIGVELH